jgi:integrase
MLAFGPPGYTTPDTTATLLLVAGIDARVVMDLMGWSSGSMVKRYQHVVDERK